jgi:hypothetical protein
MSWRHWLLLAPFVWQLGCAPFINDVEIPGWPVPFPLIWQMLGVVLTTVVIALAYQVDKSVEDSDHAAEEPGE